MDNQLLNILNFVMYSVLVVFYIFFSRANLYSKDEIKSRDILRIRHAWIYNRNSINYKELVLMH
jgi:hypothetical protein